VAGEIAGSGLSTEVGRFTAWRRWNSGGVGEERNGRRQQHEIDEEVAYSADLMDRAEEQDRRERVLDSRERVLDSREHALDDRRAAADRLDDDMRAREVAADRRDDRLGVRERDVAARERDADQREIDAELDRPPSGD
jgi:uncharacterized protein (DUF3084 family)